MSERTDEALKALQTVAEEVKRCQRCGLGKTRFKAVPGEGPADARIMFIGEAPGYHENQQGRPFVGQAGKLLEDLLASIGLKREEVFIANVIKCRPAANRDPLPAEIQACAAFLDRQIEAIKPKIIVTLGRYSMARYFPGQTISRIHGAPKKGNGVVYYPVYHPAAALHQPSLRQALEIDFRKIPEIIDSLQPYESAEPESLPMEQMKLL
ncbi:MAG: uracil-DNA glycosylase [Dehalococcoidales bacterium]|nr:uracil-DNA glycosylase [Dehalococcoidales bacterium]